MNPNEFKQMKKLVIFDLDGTLLNTIYDLAHSTNFALAENGFPTHEVAEYNYFVGNGINKLFERALPEGQRSEENIARIREKFLIHYDRHNADRSRPYEGIPELLGALASKGIRLAVASNKYQAATEKLIAHFFPRIPFSVVFGQREGIPTKPDPSVVREILKLTATNASDALYVGDSGVDMQTALNSGIEACGVSWGFRPVEELEHFHPAHIVKAPEEILALV